MAQSEPAPADGPAELRLGALPCAGGDVVYTPGAGLRLGETGLSLGGYGRVDLTRDEGDPAELALEGLSLFTIWDPLSRLRLFAETELEEAVHVDERGHGGISDLEFAVERLYGDATLSDRIHVRAGKFLTPVGRWNLIHAAPLVWTTSRPLITIVPFATHTTGAMVHGNLNAAGSVSYSVFGQFVDSFETSSDEIDPADRSGGFRLELSPTSSWAVGSAYVAAHRDSSWSHVAGADVLWRRRPIEIMSEAVVENSDSGGRTQWGLYVQTVVEVRSGWFAVARYEHFRRRVPSMEINLAALGLAYKPLGFLVLKGEYLLADERADESPPGLKFSFAILF